jgi:hypothetical protein
MTNTQPKPIDSTSTNEKVSEILEVLSIGRAQTKLLRTPEEIFPPEYSSRLFRRIPYNMPPNHPAWRLALEALEKLRLILENTGQGKAAKELFNDALRHPSYIRRGGRSYPLRPDALEIDRDVDAVRARVRRRVAEEAAEEASRAAEEAAEEASRAAEEAEE